MRFASTLLATSSAAVLLAGCSGGDNAVPAPSTTTTTITTTSTQATPTTTPDIAVPTGTLPVSIAASEGAQLSVTRVRLGEHPGFDRVVFDLGGMGTPGAMVSFTDDPRLDGSGERLAMVGRTVIQVVITGVGYPGDTGVSAFTGRVDGVGGIAGVYVGGPFEGQVLAYIGVDAENPGVRVSILASPTRLVIDIAR